MKTLPQPDEIFFDDRPDFQPHFSPTTMLKLGVFKGGYFNDEPAGRLGWSNLRVTFPNDGPLWVELNKALPKVSDYAAKLCNTTPDKSINFFGVNAGKNQAYWEEKGWIHPDDPRGWFEWYIKFYYGRRHEDDDRQIKRWKDFITRHWGMLHSLCWKHVGYLTETADVPELGPKASPTTCQNLLQWGWDYRIKPNFKNK